MFNKTEIIKKWKGIKYRLNGRDVNGVDCIGLIYAIYADYGEYFPGSCLRKTHPEDIKTWFNLAAIYFQRISNPELGDMIWLRYPNNQTVHCGFCLGNGEFIHILNGSVKVDKIKRFCARIMKIVRLKDKFKCHQQ